ncbi:hypothetical protein [Lacticaseibacillus sp. 53-4]|uniref:hypothetical protein n=1 Tax=Lacticaseibacillus sp. 53-4 TaxID=2799575 RepID=UPI0019455F80|nr:hypothetical protein [Lacticaseibacillus sp. 53-4]
MKVTNVQYRDNPAAAFAAFTSIMNSLSKDDYADFRPELSVVSEYLAYQTAKAALSAEEKDNENNL